MRKFTHGIMVLNVKRTTEEPTKEDIEHIKNELKNDPAFRFRDIFDELEFFAATQDCLDYYNNQIEEDDVFNIENINLN